MKHIIQSAMVRHQFPSFSPFSDIRLRFILRLKINMYEFLKYAYTLIISLTDLH